jgi:transcriptional regulator with XRE-family HTH domain
LFDKLYSRDKNGGWQAAKKHGEASRISEIAQIRKDEAVMKRIVPDGGCAAFGDFLIAKRREKEMPALRICDAAGISPSYYCDIERNRRYPPDREMLDRIAEALRLGGEDVAAFYDLAGRARSEAPPDLPEYINEYQVVRVALRLAKEKGCEDDWRRFIRDLERKPANGG